MDHERDLWGPVLVCPGKSVSFSGLNSVILGSFGVFMESRESQPDQQRLPAEKISAMDLALERRQRGDDEQRMLFVHSSFIGDGVRSKG